MRDTHTLRKFTSVSTVKLFPKIAIKRGKIFIKQISSAIIHASPSATLCPQGTHECKKNERIIPINVSLQNLEPRPKTRSKRRRSQGDKNHPYSLPLLTTKVWNLQ